MKIEVLHSDGTREIVKSPIQLEKGDTLLIDGIPDDFEKYELGDNILSFSHNGEMLIIKGINIFESNKENFDTYDEVVDYDNLHTSIVFEDGSIIDDLQDTLDLLETSAGEEPQGQVHYPAEFLERNGDETNIEADLRTTNSDEELREIERSRSLYEYGDDTYRNEDPVSKNGGIIEEIPEDIGGVYVKLVDPKDGAPVVEEIQTPEDNTIENGESETELPELPEDESEQILEDEETEVIIDQEETDDEIESVQPVEENEDPTIPEEEKEDPIIPENEEEENEENEDPIIPEENEDPIIPENEENEDPIIPEENEDPIIPEENEDPIIPENEDPIIPEENEDPIIPEEVKDDNIESDDSVDYNDSDDSVDSPGGGGSSEDEENSNDSEIVFITEDYTDTKTITKIEFQDIEVEKAKEIEIKTEVEAPTKIVSYDDVYESRTETFTDIKIETEEFTNTREVAETFTNTRIETEEFQDTRTIDGEDIMGTRPTNIIDTDAMKSAGFIKINEGNEWAKETEETFTNTREVEETFTNTRDIEVNFEDIKTETETFTDIKIETEEFTNTREVAETFTNTRIETEEQEVTVEKTREIIDIDAMESYGYILIDGVWKEVSGQELQEVEHSKEITELVYEDSPIMKEESYEVTNTTSGEPFNILGGDLSAGSSMTLELGQTTNNIEIVFKHFKDFKDFDFVNEVKIEFIKDSEVVGETTQEGFGNNGKNDEGFYNETVFDSVRFTSENPNLEIASVSGMGQDVTITETIDGLVIDTDAMEASGYTYSDIDAENISGREGWYKEETETITWFEKEVIDVYLDVDPIMTTETFIVTETEMVDVTVEFQDTRMVIEEFQDTREVEVEFENTREVEITFTNTRMATEEFQDTRMVIEEFQDTRTVRTLAQKDQIIYEFEEYIADNNVSIETFTNTRDVTVEFEDTRIVEEEFQDTRDIITEFEDEREIQVLISPAYEEVVIDEDKVSELGLVEKDGIYYEVTNETVTYTETEKQEVEVTEEVEFESSRLLVEDLEMVIDFDSIAQKAVEEGVNEIDIGNNIVNIDMDDILILSSEEDIIITGEDGSKININLPDSEEETFTKVDTSEKSGETFDVYISSNVSNELNIYLEQNINTDFI